ncbi:addiction module antidote protein [Janthinobacterium sp.]|uniref:addiction module antidote protein n=1 Tax=Janthinobacterium sp. TaxID=1871054 RepID=UPI00293D4F0A|nr:addiction module antidote protein [Janthinobacterium sp.]
MSEHNIGVADLDGTGIGNFDASDCLTSDKAVAAYLTEVLETNDAALLAAAVGNIARARGMADIAKSAGLTREGLYKALRPNSQPRMETITKVLAALGVRLVAEPIAAEVVPAVARSRASLSTEAKPARPRPARA